MFVLIKLLLKYGMVKQTRVIRANHSRLALQVDVKTTPDHITLVR